MIIAAKLISYLPLLGAAVGLLGVFFTLLLTGARAERQRRRELYARALAAVNAYYEMPFEIRRRRWQPDERSAERVRLSQRFSEVQAELSSAQALMRADGHTRLADLYDELVGVVRKEAGGQAGQAWKTEPITSDAEVGLPDVREALKPVDDRRAEFTKAIGVAGRRLWAWERPAPPVHDHA